jgi:dienelactone hydrolase
VDYRKPAHLDPCIEDALAGAAFLSTIGAVRIVFVGHSFGGAVAISAAVAFPAAVGAVALSSQTQGAAGVRRLSPKSLLLIHGEADEILPASCSHQLFRDAGEPKQIILYRDGRHGLDDCRDELDRDLSAWLLQTFKLG